ncbi:MAG: PAS domain-containing protein, partial [Terriglobales bacterium]
MAKAGKRGRKAPPRTRRTPVAPRRSGGERLELAMRAINEGVYDWDVVNGTIHYSESVYSVMQLPRSMKTPAGWRARIHPDDLAAYDAAILAHFKKKTRRFECDCRYLARDRSWRWARQHGLALRDARGRAVRMIGSIGDISELKRVEQALKESEQRYALAAQAATEGIYEWNLETGLLYLSDRAKTFFAVAGDALTPAAWNSRVHGEDFQGYRDAIVSYFKGRKPNFEHEYRLRNAAGGYSWVVDRAVAVRNDAGRAIRLVGAMTDITQRKLHEIELQRARDEAAEALEQQKASAEVLGAISSSISDTKPVFDRILEGCERIFAGRLVGINVLREDGMLHLGAYHGPGRDAFEKIFPLPANEETGSGAAMLNRRVMHYPDVDNGPDVPASTRRGCNAIGIKSVIFAPMIGEQGGIGAIFVGREEPIPFTEKEIELLKTFASQAAIGIKNVRFFNETKEA